MKLENGLKEDNIDLFNKYVKEFGGSDIESVIKNFNIYLRTIYTCYDLDLILEISIIDPLETYKNNPMVKIHIKSRNRFATYSKTLGNKYIYSYLYDLSLLQTNIIFDYTDLIKCNLTNNLDRLRNNFPILNSMNEDQEKVLHYGDHFRLYERIVSNTNNMILNKVEFFYPNIDSINYDSEMMEEERYQYLLQKLDNTKLDLHLRSFCNYINKLDSNIKVCCFLDCCHYGEHTDEYINLEVIGLNKLYSSCRVDCQSICIEDSIKNFNLFKMSDIFDLFKSNKYVYKHKDIYKRKVILDKLKEDEG